MSQVKAHEQFKNYTLAVLVGVLKSHEDGVTNDSLVSNLGTLALIVKGKKAAVLKMDLIPISQTRKYLVKIKH